MNSPRRGEIWTANLGSPPIRHWVLIVSIDSRNLSDRIDTVLTVPFSSRGPAAPTVVEIPAGESGLPGPSYVKGHYMQILDKR
ncbi:MAG TPA: type II toxin-antitoxin system PemK/MazF family toxin, partial [Candidatus Binatia bacterium]|nr:type II toxin-antitoxin system PemK/MazF family toxin [Candidatus Binatia bacterium]